MLRVFEKIGGSDELSAELSAVEGKEEEETIDVDEEVFNLLEDGEAQLEQLVDDDIAVERAVTTVPCADSNAKVP